MFSQFETDFTVSNDKDHHVTTAVLHLGRRNGKHGPLHYWTNNIANLTAARDHYAAHGFDIIKHILYTSKDTWKETYESAPLEQGAILALSNVNGSIGVKFQGSSFRPANER